MTSQGRYRKWLGQDGEDEAVHYLEKKGYRILKRNFRLGRGEIDIIAKDGKVLVFIEVKTKAREGFGEPEDRVTFKKQQQIGKVALGYLQKEVNRETDCRFDVITVDRTGDSTEIGHFEDAFWLNPQKRKKQYRSMQGGQ